MFKKIECLINVFLRFKIYVYIFLSIYLLKNMLLGKKIDMISKKTFILIFYKNNFFLNSFFVKIF